MESVPKGFNYDWLNTIQYNNIVYPIDKIPDRMLRLCERRNPIIGAGVTLRVQQGIEFCHVSHDKDTPGWEFSLKDKKESMSPEREKQKEFLEYFLQYGHVPGYTSFNLADKPSNIKDRITRYVRDRLLIDKVVWEVERDRKGRSVALWVMDGATIFPVLPGGFYGSTSQISAGMQVGFNQINEKIRQARIENIPPIEKISYVQELLYGMSGGGITAADGFGGVVGGGVTGQAIHPTHRDKAAMNGAPGSGQFESSGRLFIADPKAAPKASPMAIPSGRLCSAAPIATPKLIPIPIPAPRDLSFFGI